MMQINIYSLKQLKHFIYIKQTFKKRAKLGSNLLKAPIQDAPNTTSCIDNIDYSRFNAETSKFIESFEKTLKEKLPNINLSFFYSNVNIVTINEIDETYDMNEKINPAYFQVDYTDKILDCRINYIKGKNDHLSHEALHLSTSTVIDNKYYVGFKQSLTLNQKECTIGKGLNETYTSILDIRYFKNNTNDDEEPTYMVSRHLVRKLEEIIGQNTMEELYFNADLKGLINELEKYNTLDNIIAFIVILDDINWYYTHFNEFDKENKNNVIFFLKIAYKYIGDFLVSTYINKINDEIQNNNADSKELAKKLKKFIVYLACDNSMPLAKGIKYLHKAKKIEKKK